MVIKQHLNISGTKSIQDSLEGKEKLLLIL